MGSATPAYQPVEGSVPYLESIFSMDQRSTMSFWGTRMAPSPPPWMRRGGKQKPALTHGLEKGSRHLSLTDYHRDGDP
jgi:hypothetical protein